MSVYVNSPPCDKFDESQDEGNYGTAARTKFQKYIRLKKNEMSLPDSQEEGANFTDLPGVLVKDNKAELDPLVERVMLDSGKPLVPDYAIKFVRGTSSKPFGRLWWDEIVPIMVTGAEPHNQVILHPTQNRVLTIGENVRLQGFPDCYKPCGTVKERYIQVGNTVAVPVALAMGCTFDSVKDPKILCFYNLKGEVHADSCKRSKHMKDLFRSRFLV
ncbi:DNA (cytosine-5)-methyltransferase 3 [Spatholobus suberectus]|nr:DNA (cytosine-5)-methyltransferase 3 [Spatholobus suberectus]